MKSDGQPKICKVCHALKAENLGRLVSSKTRYNQKYFICDHCNDKPKGVRSRNHRETPPEREVRIALEESVFNVDQEHKVGPYFYDFAVPKLRLLIEIDSASYHKFPRQRSRDKDKTRIAHENRWKLIRLKVGPSVGQQALKAVLDRVLELK